MLIKHCLGLTGILYLYILVLPGKGNDLYVEVVQSVCDVLNYPRCQNFSMLICYDKLKNCEKRYFWADADNNCLREVDFDGNSFKMTVKNGTHHLYKQPKNIDVSRYFVAVYSTNDIISISADNPVAMLCQNPLEPTKNVLSFNDTTGPSRLKLRITEIVVSTTTREEENITVTAMPTETSNVTTISGTHFSTATTLKHPIHNKSVSNLILSTLMTKPYQNKTTTIHAATTPAPLPFTDFHSTSAHSSSITTEGSGKNNTTTIIVVVISGVVLVAVLFIACLLYKRSCKPNISVSDSKPLIKGGNEGTANPSASVTSLLSNHDEDTDTRDRKVSFQDEKRRPISSIEKTAEIVHRTENLQHSSTLIEKEDKTPVEEMTPTESDATEDSDRSEDVHKDSHDDNQSSGQSESGTSNDQKPDDNTTEETDKSSVDGEKTSEKESKANATDDSKGREISTKHVQNHEQSDEPNLSQDENLHVHTEDTSAAKEANFRIENSQTHYTSRNRTVNEEETTTSNVLGASAKIHDSKKKKKHRRRKNRRKTDESEDDEQFHHQMREMRITKERVKGLDSRVAELENFTNTRLREVEDLKYKYKKRKIKDKEKMKKLSNRNAELEENLFKLEENLKIMNRRAEKKGSEIKSIQSKIEDVKREIKEIKTKQVENEQALVSSTKQAAPVDIEKIKQEVESIRKTIKKKKRKKEQETVFEAENLKVMKKPNGDIVLEMDTPRKYSYDPL